MLDVIHELTQRIKVLESRFQEMGYNMTAVAQSEVKKRWKIVPQSQSMFGMFTALCVDTVDPIKQNRVRFYSPYFHRNDIPIKALPWADSISACGGFDDCGLNWVPPAGSTLCIVFEMGARSTPFYIGTTWHRDRGASPHNWGYHIDEFYKIHSGHRKGYLVGPNDESQVFPQWNTESYNGFDQGTTTDFENDPEARRKITYPNIYGMKTPQKHMSKWVDGDYKCNHKFKRMEWLSSCGNWMIFKDDWLHNCGTWAHPSCGVEGPELDCIDRETGKPKEKTECEGEKSNSSILGGHPSTPKGTTYDLESNKGSNPYFKHENECRPYKGPGTPKNNKCMLPQSGIQFLSRSGHTWMMDDSVEEPRGVPEWESSTKPFDFGCNDKYLGKVMIISATGHEIHISDVEKESKLRGDQNFIRLKTATGNLIEMNDHTVGKKDCPGSPPNLAGSKRGIALVSTSNHHIMMIDEDNEQSSPCRKDSGNVEWDAAGSSNIPKAKKGFVRIRSGYGLEIIMKDDNSQEDTEKQFIRIFCPQKDNKDRGPHFMLFQERPSGPGLVLLRVGGDYVCSTYDNHYTIIGDKEKNPSNKIVVVSKNYIEVAEEFYANFAKLHLFLADEYIFLLAGKELPPRCKDINDKCVPCACPVVCMNQMGDLVISDRVFVSASPDAQCANIMQLLPFTSCKKPPTCSEDT
jgi:hypothetical protein